MEVKETSLPGVLILKPAVFEDERGFFFESYHHLRLEACGIRGHFVQDNHSRSVKNTLRGLHYQVEKEQARLCRVVHGAVVDVAVDIRVGSPHFGEWVAEVLSAENKRQIYIPRGFAHGFLVLSETAEFLYKCDNYYAPEHERGIAWNDPQIGVDWRVDSMTPLLSRKDERNPFTSEIAPADLPLFER